MPMLMLDVDHGVRRLGLHMVDALPINNIVNIWSSPLIECRCSR